MRFPLIAIGLMIGTLNAQQPPKTMTKMEVILQGSDVPAGSFATKPKIMYRSGTQYCRIEEAPDPARNIHGLMIVNEPNAWMVNLATKSAQHVVDPGPTFNCRLPIFGGRALELPEVEAKEISGLEFGLEMAFFLKNGATPHPGGILQTKQTTAYKIQIGASTVALFTYGTPERPLAVAWTRGDLNEIYWYQGYGQLDFDPGLFAKPDHVKIDDSSSQ